MTTTDQNLVERTRLTDEQRWKAFDDNDGGKELAKVARAKALWAVVDLLVDRGDNYPVPGIGFHLKQTAFAIRLQLEAAGIERLQLD